MEREREREKVCVIEDCCGEREKVCSIEMINVSIERESEKMCDRDNYCVDRGSVCVFVCRERERKEIKSVC